MDNETSILLVTLDLIGLLKFHLDPVVLQISMATGIDTDHIFIHCTHTHSGPATLAKPLGLISYRRKLKRAIMETVLIAIDNRVNVKAVARSGISHTDIINRRHPTREVSLPFSSLDFIVSS